MPSYDGSLDETQIAGVAAYIRLLSGAATAADTTLTSKDAAEQENMQPDEGGMGDPGVPVADPVAPREREIVRQGAADPERQQQNQ